MYPLKTSLLVSHSFSARHIQVAWWRLFCRTIIDIWPARIWRRAYQATRGLQTQSTSNRRSKGQADLWHFRYLMVPFSQTFTLNLTYYSNENIYRLSLSYPHYPHPMAQGSLQNFEKCKIILKQGRPLSSPACVVKRYFLLFTSNWNSFPKLMTWWYCLFRMPLSFDVIDFPEAKLNGFQL